MTVALHFLTDAATAAQAGDVVTLTGAEAHHAAAVRRVRVGEPVTLGDGRGAWLDGRCATVSPSRVDVAVDARRDVPPASPRLVLVQALAKGGRDEQAVQAATELGVDAVVPWRAARSIARWDAARAAKGIARWHAICREATKQAHRAWLPDVAAVHTTADVAARAVAAHVVVLEPSATERLGAMAFDGRDVVLVVGPEGGIDERERRAFADAGADVVALGDTVLRTSTAGPAALAVTSLRLGRW